ncbi:MAG: RNA 2'-phosphotransferase [Thermoplasmata archaeon]|nr:MAG: RNA 2'-phosphotransferase [Thermoplasmata archaeon]
MIAMNLVAVSKYLSYLLRHNPEGLPISKDGFIPIEDILKKIRKRFPNVDEKILYKLNEGSKSRFEIKNGRIRALYGHTIPVEIPLEIDIDVEILYHGTTKEAAEKILKEGLKRKGRRKVHLSSTIQQAIRVGKRRTKNPVILKIDAESARNNGIVFEKANDLVYLSEEIPPIFISKLSNNED